MPAFPASAVVSDAFTRANETPLSLVSGWQQKANDGTTTTAALLGVYGNIAAANQNGVGSQVWNTAAVNADIYATIVAGKQAQGNILAGLYQRIDTPSATFNGVALEVTETAGAESWQFRKIVAGSPSNVGSATSQAVAVGNRIGFRAEGTTLTGYLHNGTSWSQVMQVTDATVPTASGFPALLTQGNATGFDDWTVAAFASSSASTAPPSAPAVPAIPSVG